MKRLIPPLLLALSVGLSATALPRVAHAQERPEGGGVPPAREQKPDAEPLRRLVLEYTLAVHAGDREKAVRLLVPSDRHAADLEATLREKRGIADLLSAVREKFGDRAANALYQRSDRAALEKSLAFYEVRKPAFGEGWVLAYIPQPGGVRARELANEVVLVMTPGGWRIVPPASVDDPPWRERQLAAWTERLVAILGDVTAAVREGRLNSPAAVQATLRERLATAQRQWKRKSDAALKEATAAFAKQFREAAALQFDPEPVQELAFDAAGKRLAVGLINTPRSLHLLDVETGKARDLALSDAETERHVEALAFVGEKLAVAGAGFDRKRTDGARAERRRPDFAPEQVEDGKLRLIDPAGGAVTATLEGHDGYTTDAVAAGGVLYTVGTDNVLRAWKAGAEPALSWERRFVQFGGPYHAALVGDVVAVASPLSVVALFEREGGRPIANVSFLSGGLTAPIVDLSQRHLALAALGEVKLVDLSLIPRPDKNAARDKNAEDDENAAEPLRTYSDLPERRLSESWLGLSRVNDVAAAPAADLLASGDGFPNPGALTDPPHGPGVRLWRATSGQWLGWLPMPAPVTAVALSPDGLLLAVGDTRGRVKVLRLPEQLRPADPDAGAHQVK